MEEKLRVIKEKDGSLWIVVNGKSVYQIRTDGVTGYGFVREYLRTIGVHFRSHLIAVDMILQRMMGDRYAHVRKVSNVYYSHLVAVSLCCRFTDGCAVRSACPFNGFHPSNKGKLIVGCNPVYELPMTPTQVRVAELLVNTAYSLSDMAEVLCLSESRVRSLASIVYATMGVDGRQELVILLRGKRIS